MSKHALAGVIGQRERIIINSVVDAVRANSENKALEFLPIKNVPAAIFINTQLSSWGGQTGERALDAQGKSIPARSHVTKYFAPGFYQESIRFNERDILMYAKAGTLNERGITGISNDQLDEMTLAAEKLKGRIENRMSKLIWDTFFLGQYSYMGTTTSFGVPTANGFQASTDWGNFATSTPFTDLWSLLQYSPIYRKYKIAEILMNPKTFSDIMLSTETRNVLKNYNLNSADPNAVAQFLVPGLPPIRVVRDAYQDESYEADGTVTLTDASYMVPDDRVLFVPDFGRQIYKSFGEFQVAENMNAPEATLARPAQGIYVFVDEKGLEQRKNPYVEIVAGFNGAPNLMRAADILTMKTRP
jgi:hypothetical protein